MTAQFIIRDGNKSKNDKRYYLNCDKDLIKYTLIGKIVGRLAKNEWILTKEISYYTKNAELLKEFLNEICNKDWTNTDNKMMDKEIDELYNKKYGKKNETTK